MKCELDADQLDQAAGVLIASAAGNALGAGYEFSIPADGAVISMIGGGPSDSTPGEWTDDTSMALAVAQAAAASGFMRWVDPRCIGCHVIPSNSWAAETTESYDRH